MPRSIKDVFRGNLPASFAAIGAAINPPTINAMMVCKCVTPNKMKNEKALASVTKNSVRLTVPITKRGLLPLVINVVVTIGPQPPPPNESRKPPAAANGINFLNFFCGFICLKAFSRIFTPRNKV